MSVTTKLNEEIDPGLRQDIRKIKTGLFKAIKDKDYKKIDRFLSPRLSESKEINIKSFIDKISGMIRTNEFVIKDQYHSKLKKIVKEAKSKTTIIPSLSKKNKFIINNLVFYGNESYNLFLTSINPGWQYLFYLSFSNEENTWKINLMNVGDFSINNLAAPDLHALGKAAQKNGRLTSCAIYSWAINKLLRPARNLQYVDEKKYIQFIKSSFSDFEKTIKLPIRADDKEIFGIQVETTKKEGLIPVILYLTDKKFDDPVVDAEAKEMKDTVLEKFNGLDHDFDYLLMRAYNEMPSDPKKEYFLLDNISK